jgi:hypothetical protein
MLSSENQPSTVLSSTSVPAVEEIDRIAALTYPVNRNLQITNCYSELSAAFAARTGLVANWCTFATWASKQAGVTIRGEDLERTLEDVLRRDPEIQRILSLIAMQSKILGSEEAQQLQESALGKLISSAAARASDAVARGNKKVFEEIGREFARFIATCLNDDVYKESVIVDFSRKFVPGPPPDGQDYLRKAFTRYYTALYETDPKKRDELRLLANIEIGFHEQARLQPEITESLNAGLVDPQHVRDYVLNILVSSKNLWGKILYFFKWLIGKTSLLKKAVDSLVFAAEGHIRRVITANLMTLTLPPGNCLHLGQDLVADYPEDLKQLTNPELLALLAQIEPTTNNPRGEGATDWSELKQRLHFIADLFRCYHETKDLFNEAFTSQQIAVLKAGGLPEGPL